MRNVSRADEAEWYGPKYRAWSARMLRTTSTRGNTSRFVVGVSASGGDGGFGSTSRSTRYCLSSRSFTLKRGWCFLMRWFSRSSASLDDDTTMVSTSVTARPR